MFTAVEMDYVSSLVEQMRGQGYLYYIARTVTESGNNYDCELIFSKEEITANGLYSYRVTNGVRYRVDSSGYTIGSGGLGGNNGPRVSVATYSGTYTFQDTEFCYTNATFSGYSVQPDLRLKGGKVNENGTAMVYIVALLGLVLFFALLFRRR